MNLSILSLLLLAIVQTISSDKYCPVNDFGMNKPHLMFQVGERKKVGTNYGWAYWENHKSSRTHFGSMRLFYENSKNGLYINMLSHDGDSHLHQKIEDSRQQIVSEVKYQMLKDGWEYEVNMKRSEGANSSSTYWMNYMTIENTDHGLVKHFDHPNKTPKFYTVTSLNDGSATISISKINEPSEQIQIQSSQPLKVFGFSMNISETYDIRNSMEQVKYLIQLQRYQMKKRKNDSDLVRWEDEQIKLMRKGQWTGSKFVVLVFYGQFEEQCSFTVSNRSAEFDTKHFEKHSKELDVRYFHGQSYNQHGQFLKHILYNLYGGIAFYQGILFTQNSLTRHQFDSFHSFTPSRLIFPRGFLWDDGFHLSVAVHYNPSLTINMLKNWLKKIDLFGWIGREQIRGFQMGALMPQAKFIYQDMFQMNPPTLIMPILALIQKIQNNEVDQTIRNQMNMLLSRNFWKLEKWYRYFLKTQSHGNLVQKEAINKTNKYRWRCKDDCQRGNFMGSGLDDYPRVEEEGQLSKQHVDLMSWIYFFSEGLEKIATYLSQSKPAYYYRVKKLEIKKKIFQECLDHQDMIFKDQVVKAKNEYVDALVTKIGYISVFPFITGVLQDNISDEQSSHSVFTSEQMTQIEALKNKLFPEEGTQLLKRARSKLVEIMRDPELLLSEDGIRSLSKSDIFYGTLDNYWRGPVWMPINYMILRACKKYYWHDQQVRQLYQQLRTRLIETVKGNWQQTGYLYENYHKGKGNRGYPFYGWSSLIAQIITEEY